MGIKYPAYGKKLMDLRKSGQIPPRQEVWIVFDWKLGGVFTRIVSDSEASQSDYEWRYLAGLDVVIAYHYKTAEAAKNAVKSILKVNPRSLLCFHVDGGGFFFVKTLDGEVML